MPEIGTQVYWHELPVQVPPWEDNIELCRLLQESGLPLPPGFVTAAEQLRATTEAEERRNRKRPRVGVNVDEELSTLDAINAVMQSIHCEEVSLEELLLATYDVLTNDETDPCAADVLAKLAQRRGLVVSLLDGAAIKERKHKIAATDLEIERQALFVLDMERPIFVTGYPVACRRTRHGVRMHLVVPIPDPLPWRRLTSKMHHLSASECQVMFLTRPATVESFATLDPIEYDEDHMEQLKERLAAQGNPFSAIPTMRTAGGRPSFAGAAGDTSGGGVTSGGKANVGPRKAAKRKKQNLKIKYPWYQRIMDKDAVEALKKDAYRHSQLTQLRAEQEEGDY